MKYIAYYRVSTQKQGASGLGLDAQRIAVTAFVSCTDCIISEYVEIESGKNNRRVQLDAALAHARAAGAVLVVAKLDRLSRSISFLFALRDSGVDFRCVDMPDLNTLTLGMFATIAQHERELISERTRAALAAKKERGDKLGNPQNLTDEARARGRATRTEKSRTNPNNTRAAALAISLHQSGVGLREIARRLNANGFQAAKGGHFQAVQVSRLLSRPTQ
jgi:DNA invertase Pin-like site-specific DNA recombinase